MPALTRGGPTDTGSRGQGEAGKPRAGRKGQGQQEAHAEEDVYPGPTRASGAPRPFLPLRGAPRQDPRGHSLL